MERAAADVASAWATHYHRTGEPRAVARSRDVVRQHVVRAGDEISELHLRDGAHPHVRGSRRRADDRDFGERRVDHAIRTEPGLQALGDLECATERADVLTEAEHRGVALHLLEQRLADGLQVGDGSHVQARYQWGASREGPA